MNRVTDGRSRQNDGCVKSEMVVGCGKIQRRNPGHLLHAAQDSFHFGFDHQPGANGVPGVSVDAPNFQFRDMGSGRLKGM
ncbi:hypothetical protein [Lihuaxuella thermophila]|uniref:hypothetical protein n=1 Tax=Lihuaxuella thermophila TaxID=1173111 RepID=UPI000B7E5F84|nr:hypothetical protein [Lihuaxuella thermophila]